MRTTAAQTDSGPTRSGEPSPTNDGIQRVLPLTGVAAAALVVAGHLAHGSVPAARDNIDKVTAFYRTHDTHIYVGSVLLALAAFVFMAFAEVLRERLRPNGNDGHDASTFGFGGAVLFAIGLTLTAGIGVALSHQPDKLDPAATQALHALFFDLFAPLGVGAAIFLIGNGTAILQTRTLPNWLGWSALPIGTTALAPEPVGDIGFVALGLWIVVTAVLLVAAPPQTTRSFTETRHLTRTPPSTAQNAGNGARVRSTR